MSVRSVDVNLWQLDQEGNLSSLHQISRYSDRFMLKRLPPFKSIPSYVRLGTGIQQINLNKQTRFCSQTIRLKNECKVAVNLFMSYCWGNIKNSAYTRTAHRLTDRRRGQATHVIAHLNLIKFNRVIRLQEISCKVLLIIVMECCRRTVSWRFSSYLWLSFILLSLRLMVNMFLPQGIRCFDITLDLWIKFINTTSFLIGTIISLLRLWTCYLE